MTLELKVKTDPIDHFTKRLDKLELQNVDIFSVVNEFKEDFSKFNSAMQTRDVSAKETASKIHKVQDTIRDYVELIDNLNEKISILGD